MKAETLTCDCGCGTTAEVEMSKARWLVLVQYGGHPPASKKRPGIKSAGQLF